MRIDLHVHTAPRSRCSVLDPEEAIRVARDRGLDGICFTEHNCLWEARALRELADRHGFLVLQGVEVDTPGGHILVYGLERLPARMGDLRELRQQVEEAGGIMVAAHPFRRPMHASGGYGRWSSADLPVEVAARREVFRWVDGIEVSNGRDRAEEARLALAVSQRLDLPALGGSDAHRPEEVGAGVTLFEGPLTTEADLVRALKEGRYRIPLLASGPRPEDPSGEGAINYNYPEAAFRGPTIFPCPRCLAPLKASARYCFNCGASAADPGDERREGRRIDPVGGVYCPRCGRFNSFQDTFRCPGCWESALCRAHRAGADGFICQRCHRSREEGRPLDQSPGSSPGQALSQTRTLNQVQGRLCPGPEPAPDQIRGPGFGIQSLSRTRSGGRHWEEMQEVERLRAEEAPGAGETRLLYPTPPEGMIWVPAGEFRMGDDRRRIYLEAFAIDPFPVTNLQFQQFLPQHRFPPEKAHHPVVQVHWYEAVAYARWAGKRLPTEAEWEKTARGTDGRRYPWGETFDPGRCNSLAGLVRDTTPVDRYPAGRSPYGCYDMAGNVHEWTADWYDSERNFKVFKGSCWLDHDLMARCANRTGFEPLHRFGLIGFRCAW